MVLNEYKKKKLRVVITLQEIFYLKLEKKLFKKFHILQKNHIFLRRS